MKTTIQVRDDLYRRAKARAALQGKTLGRFFEESLERMLEEKPRNEISRAEWAASLPSISEGASHALDEVLGASDFRAVDAEMWD